MKKHFFIVLLTCISLNAFTQGIDKPKYLIETYRLSNYLGAIEIELYPLVAPLHVANFDTLTAQQFFDSTAFHRVVPGFVIQGGDPNSISGPINTWGQGQPWQPTVNAEFSAVRHLRGTIGAARDSDPNSANSQFYICVGSPTYLDGDYTVFGRVTSGMNIVDSIVLSPRDVNDVPLQKISMFVTEIGTNPSVPVAPQLLLPADSASGITNIQNFTWALVDSAILYTIQFSTDSTFSTVNFSDTVGLAQAKFQTMLGSTLYYWRVRSNNGGHESPWSDFRRFNSTTGAASLVYPADSTTGIPINLNFAWNTVPNATSYRLQISTTSVFAGAPMIYNQPGITDTAQAVTNLLQPNTLYYWRVQSENATAPGMYSSRFSFTTGTSTAVNEINPTGLIVNGPWPNPAAEQFSIQFISKESAEMTLILRDVSGRELQRQTIRVNAGTTAVSIPCSELQHGVYMVEMNSGETIIFRQMVKE